MTSMPSAFPNVIVVHGAASNAVQPFMQQLPDTVLKIQLWNTTPPPEIVNAVCLHAKDNLSQSLKDLGLPSEGKERLGLVLAAVQTQERLLASETDESIERQLDANVVSLVGVVRDVLPTMIRARFGRIVFLSSFRAAAPTRGTSIYSASKSFGEVLMRSVSLEYGRFGVSASSIRMGYFEGGIMAARQEQMRASIESKIALGHMGTGEVLAEAINFVFRQPYLSGGCLDLNGGLDLG